MNETNRVLAVLKIKERGIARYSFHKIYSFPCKVGRSFDNDIIIPNSGISGSHAIIDLVDGKGFIEDCDSTNGVILNGKRVKKAQFNKKDEILIGTIHADLLLEDDYEKTVVKSMLRFNLGNQTAKEVLINTLLHSVIIYLLLLIDHWLSYPVEKKAAVTIFWNTVSKVMMAGYISAVLGVIGKIQIKRYIFKPIFAFALKVTIITLVVDTLSPYLLFLFNSRTVESFFENTALSLLVLYALYGLGRRFFPYTTAKKIAAVILCTTAGLVSLAMVSKSITADESGYNFTASYSYPVFNYDKKENGVENLFDKMDESFKEVDEKRLEDLKKKKELNN